VRWPANSPWVWPPGGGAPWVWPPGERVTADPSVPPLPAATVEWWHSEKGISLVGGQVQSWTGQKKGIALTPLTAGARPDYGADGAFFQGRSVVKTVPGAPSRVLSAPVVPAASVVGSKPHVYALIRLKTFTADARMISFPNTPLTATALTAMWFSSTGFFGAWMFPHPNVQAPPLTTAPVPHRFSTFFTPAGAISFSWDSNTNAAGSGLSLAGAFDSIHVGSDRGTNPADASFAFILCCNAQISAAEMTALDAWALSYWGVP